jgi:uncharacterized membrane protein YesL
MIGFTIRKWFYDLWDNLFQLVFLNFGFILSLAAAAFLVPRFVGHPALLILLFLAFLFWLCWYTAACAIFVQKISDYDAIRFKEFGQALKQSLRAGAILAVFAAACIVIVAVAIPFYMQLPGPVGVLLAGILFWVMVTSLLCMQFFLAGQRRLDTKQRKILKKSFIIFVDNTAFSIFTLFVSILLVFLFISVPTFILLLQDEGLRLRLFKYDWLSAHPEIDGAGRKERKKVPWAELLEEERDNVGKRGWRDFIFPWKS